MRPSRVRFSILLLAFPALVAVSCGGEAEPDLAVAMYRGGPAHTGSYDTTGVERFGGVAWTVPTGGTVRSSPAVAGDLVYVGSTDGRVTAVDRETGDEAWSHDAGSPVDSSPAVTDGKVFFATRDNTFHALDRLTGEVVWSVETGATLPFGWGWEGWDYFVSSPVLSDGVLFWGSGDGRIYALDPATGDRLWRFETGGRIRATPAVSNGTVYCGSADGILYALDAVTGQMRWMYATEGSSIDSAEAGFDRKTLQSSPAVAGGAVFFGSRDGHVYAVDAESGTLRWRFDHQVSWVVTSPAVAGGIVYAGSSDGKFAHALAAESGNEIWRTNVGSRVFASPAVVGETVYVATHEGTVVALDRFTGQGRWRYRLGAGVNSSPVVADGILYVGSDDGNLYALRAAEGPAPVAAVFWDVDAATRSLFPGHETVRDHFRDLGYRLLDSAALAEFMEARLEDGAPSVIVFAVDDLPASATGENLETSLFRRYLDAGGKIVWIGAQPLLVKRDPDTGAFAGLDRESAERLTGVDHRRMNFDSHGTRISAEGIAWGLTETWLGWPGVDPSGVTVVLAYDGTGGAAAWVRGYGGPEGTGYVVFGPGRTGDLGRADLSQIRAVAEYGILRDARAD